MRIRQAQSGAFLNTPSFPNVPNNVPIGGGVVIDWSKGPAQRVTLSANCAVTSINPAPNGERTWLQLEVVQGGAGGYTVTLPGALTPAGAQLALSTPPGSLDVLSLYWSGTTMLASVAGLAFS